VYCAGAGPPRPPIPAGGVRNTLPQTTTPIMVQYLLLREKSDLGYTDSPSVLLPGGVCPHTPQSKGYHIGKTLPEWGFERSSSTLAAHRYLSVAHRHEGGRPFAGYLRGSIPQWACLCRQAGLTRAPCPAGGPCSTLLHPAGRYRACLPARATSF
jgi:hypothetical protein